MDIDIKTVQVGLLETNCYILTADNGDMAIIDPGDDEDKILNRVSDCSKVKYILITHCHIDHVGAVNAIKKHCHEAQLYLPKKDVDFAESPKRNVLSEVTFPKIGLKYKNLKEGMKLPFGSAEFEVIATPGHTPGSVCLLLGKKLFSGDTLFYRSLGTTQFPGGDVDEQKASTNKLAKLPGETIVYPGHLRATSIRMEKEAGTL